MYTHNTHTYLDMCIHIIHTHTHTHTTYIAYNGEHTIITYQYTHTHTHTHTHTQWATHLLGPIPLGIEVLPSSPMPPVCACPALLPDTHMLWLCASGGERARASGQRVWACIYSIHIHCTHAQHIHACTAYMYTFSYRYVCTYTHRTDRHTDTDTQT